MTKITFEQLLSAADSDGQTFITQLHEYLLGKGCKAAFEEKKTSHLGSYKIGKPPKALINLLVRPQGVYVRIYGENVSHYMDFMQTIPAEMVTAIADSGDCGRLTKGTCSPKCTGYDVTIGGERYQKCRYCGFEFLMTEESRGFIKAFIENEIGERAAK